ncbi:MAG: radical SAM superfamily enzyme YgiQ (UPF0313 family)/protein-L-isoaspartate O-methyltransferase [Myxococcota bacterium]
MSDKPAVLLISPGILKWTDMDFGLPHLVSMGGYLREHTGVRVELLDLNYEGGDHIQLLKTIESLGPHLLIGVSCYSSFDYMRVMALARFLKDRLPDVPMVTGGYHASALPEDVVFDGSPFDAVVLGEGEIPMCEIVETLLGGGKLTKQRYGPALIQDLDTLPPYDWSLLDRYWPRAHALGRKFQIYLARGCPYHCTFCMERSKSGYSWRSYSPGRAVEELERLSKRTDLSRWVINIADPLFGFNRAWRREVLSGIIEKGLLPRQYWTLTRSDDLNEEDISLLARARFSIGIGLESGSPKMLAQMQKGNTAERYLGAVRRLSRLSHEHGLTWAVNVIVGHPGETPETLRETAAFVTDLFQSTDTTRGWLSVDPFRLYPGSAIHEQRADWEAKYGAKFYAPEWWKSWYDLGFHAQHLDAGREMPFETRVRAMHATYRPLLLDIADRFVGQDRSVDAVYRNSIREQAEALSDARMAHTLAQAGRSHSTVDPKIRIPLGMNLKDPWIRRREMAVRRLLARGVLRSADLIEALLQVAPERIMGPDEAGAVLDGKTPPVLAEGLLPVSVGIDVIATGLEALEPEPGQVVADVTGRSAYVGTLLSLLVGPLGRVIVNQPLPEDPATTAALEALGNVTVRCVPQDALLTLPEPVDRLWIGAALPRRPVLNTLLKPEGRAVVALGPRFRRQDLVMLRVEDGETIEQRVARMTLPILAGPHGWIRRAAPLVQPDSRVRFARRAAPALCFHLLSHLDLGADAANLHRPGLPSPEWIAPLAAAYQAAPGRLMAQVHALAYDDIDAWTADLSLAPPSPLRDVAGAALIAALLVAVEAEKGAFLVGWQDPDAATRLAGVGAALSAPLQRLRERMWEQTGAAPPLTVLDCPALGLSGRATGAGSARLVAVSLSQPRDHILCQVLHEEMHPLTDPLVREDRSSRDTRAGTPGAALHAELEGVAVAATDAFLSARAPELMADFVRWKRRLGIGEAQGGV